MVAQFGRVVDAQVAAEHEQPGGEPFEGVGSGGEQAAVRVEGADVGGVGAQAGGGPVGGQVEGDLGAVGGGQGVQLVLEERGGVASGDVAGRGALPGGAGAVTRSARNTRQSSRSRS